jgi:sodium/potassium/calcium exchanger 6
MEYMWYILLTCFVAGSIAAAIVVFTATDGSEQAWRMVRCFAGFICSMVWIAAIADEVVSVLQVCHSRTSAAARPG